MTCPGEPSEMEPCGDGECPAPGNTSGGCQCGMRRPGDSSSEDSFEQPWIGKLQLATRDFYVQDCSATLIASDWAVTAAHCLVDRSPDEMVLQLGNEFSVDADSSGNATLGLTEIIFHPEYDESGAGGLSYDVALIKLSGSADARFHWPACLPSQDADYTGDMGWMYAWGESSMVPLVEDDICSQAGNSDDEDFYAEDMICAGGASGAEVCSVEHGSPLTVEVDGRNIVTGVSSWTLGCGGDGRQYAVYSELAKVRTWIEESMAAAGGAAPCNSTSGWNSTATWGSWGAWSGCSENCDRSRERDCLFEDGMVAPSSLCDGCRQDDISCSSGSIEYQDCEDGLCGGSTTTEGTTTEGTTSAPRVITWSFGMSEAVECVKPGTSVIFEWSGSSHNVDKVGSAEDYASCSGITDTTGVSGPYTWQAPSSEGNHYFVCGIGIHCSVGNMKAAIEVSNNC